MPKEFTKEWLILCEGEEDKAFLSELIRLRGLPEFQIEFAGGWTKYGTHLNKIKEVESFKQNVKVVLVISDCDDDSRKQFNRVCRNITSDSDFGVPRNPQEKSVIKNGMPPIVILMIPIDEKTGGLEGTILKAAYSRFRVKTKLETFIGTMPSGKWKRNPKDKARIRCLIATTCKEDPNTTLRWLWKRKPCYHFPVTHKSLDRLADFLQNFGDLVNL